MNGDETSIKQQAKYFSGFSHRLYLSLYFLMEVEHLSHLVTFNQETELANE